MPTRPRAFGALLGTILVAASMLATPCRAQDASYPNKPVRIVIPYAAGGGADGAARLIAGALSKALGQSFIVDARPGGNTTIAAVAVARAAADGYTLLMTGGSTMSALPLVSEKLPFDPIADFAPVGMVSRFPYIVAVASDFGADTLAGVLARARAKPGAVAYASNGNGGMVHLGMELLAHEAGVSLLHVPYKGFSPALTDVITGRTPLMMADWGPIAGAVQAGKLKPLAVTSARRFSQLPDVPSLAELGFPAIDLVIWFGLYAPTGTPPAVIAKLNEAMSQWQRSEEARTAYARIGHEPAAATPAEVKARIATEHAVFAALVKRVNIKAD